MASEPGPANEHRSYDNLVLVQRVLAVLQSINRLPVVTIKGISEDCGIPRPSVVRIMETLCAEGYVKQVSRSAGYVLTSKIRTLSAGFHGAPLVVEVLKSYADELTKSHLWPCAVATLERDAMVIQYSSIPLSPHAHVRSTMYKRLSLLSRAHGIAYLAFCPSLERHRLVRLATALQNPEDRIVTDAHYWRHQILQTRRRGFALRVSVTDRFTRTIAVPVQIEPGRVAATLGITFFRSVVRESQMGALAAALKAAAARAADQIRRELASTGTTLPDPTARPAQVDDIRPNSGDRVDLMGFRTDPDAPAPDDLVSGVQ